MRRLVTMICKLRGHKWGTAYSSSSGRRICVRCGHVTDGHSRMLGVAEKDGARRER